MYQFINQLSYCLVLIEQDPIHHTNYIKQINSAAAALLGYSEQELVKKPIQSVSSFEKWQTVLTDTQSFEAEFITKNKVIFKALVSVCLLPEQQENKSDTLLLIQSQSDNSSAENDLPVMLRALEQSASAVIIADYTGRIEYINPKFSEVSGYSQEELLGQNPKILQSGRTTSEHYQSIWKALFSTGEWHGEIENQKKNGEIYWAYECVSAVKNSQGEITHFLAIEEDITEQKKAKADLSESEERFRQMAEMTGEWLWEQDPEGYYIYSSTAVKEILGFNPNEVTGKHYTEFLVVQDKVIQQVFANSQQPFYALICHYQHKNGDIVLTESTGLPLFDTEGKLLKWRGVDRDITARVHFQDALVDSEKRIRLVLDSSFNAIVIMDSYGLIIDWNNTAEKMFGWSHTEAVGQRLEDLIIPLRFREAHRAGLEKFLRLGVGPYLNQLIEQIALRRDGSEFPVELNFSPLKQGNAYIFSGFIHDISARKAAEQQIRMAQIDLALSQGEIKIAQNIQASLLPSNPIKTAQFTVKGFCLPADQVGGDYFDYFLCNNKRLDMVIADVSGHSIGPALFMVEVRSAIRTLANELCSPEKTLNTLNGFLFEDLNKSDFFITLFYLQYDINRQEICFASAGHPPPLLCSPSQKICRELDADGLILGVRKQVVFEKKTLKVFQGDIILFYTDGIIEAENADGEFFGFKRLATTVLEHSRLSPDDIIKALIKELKQFCQTEQFNDDITLMIFKRV